MTSNDPKSKNQYKLYVNWIKKNVSTTMFCIMNFKIPFFLLLVPWGERDESKSSWTPHWQIKIIIITRHPIPPPHSLGHTELKVKTKQQQLTKNMKNILFSWSGVRQLNWTVYNEVRFLFPLLPVCVVPLGGHIDISAMPFATRSFHFDKFYSWLSFPPPHGTSFWGHLGAGHLPDRPIIKQ